MICERIPHKNNKTKIFNKLPAAQSKKFYLLTTAVSAFPKPPVPSASQESLPKLLQLRPPPPPQPSSRRSGEIFCE